MGHCLKCPLGVFGSPSDTLYCLQSQQSTMDLQIDPKETVRIYRNLRHGCWSVQRQIPGKGWRVVGHTSDVVLDNVYFRVNENGRNRVRRERKKYVHAYCYGNLRENTLGCNQKMVRVNYNPYRDDHFNTRHGEVYQADRVWLTNKGEVYCE